jgi:hypothetical protein
MTARLTNQAAYHKILRNKAYINSRDLTRLHA